MAWRLKMKARKAPPGMDIIAGKLEEFENRTREALNTSADDKRRNEITWPMHKLHYEKNRYLYDMHYKRRRISKQLLDYLVHEKIADGKLIAKWKRPGYETLCSLLVITKKNTNFGSVGVCRIRLKDRRGQILPNVLTGCVSCASGDGGPIWWDDPIPNIVKQRIAQVDPGKAELVDTGEEVQHPGSNQADTDVQPEEVLVEPQDGNINNPIPVISASASNESNAIHDGDEAVNISQREDA